MRWVLGGAADAEVDLLSAYAVPARDAGPFVRSNFATSLDGSVEVSGTSKGVSSDADREVFHIMRSLCDVVLVGAGTVRAEGYGPYRSTPERRKVRRDLGFDDVPPIAVITRSGDLDPKSKLFTEAETKTLVLVPAKSASTCEHLREVAEVVIAGEDSVTAIAAIAALGARNLTRILCEGGPHLHHSLVAGGGLNELCLTLSPLLAGPSHQHLAAGPLESPARFTTSHAIEHEGSLFLRLSVNR